MPYPNEHAARVKDPAMFEDKSLRRRKVGKGVSVITEASKSSNARMVQSYRFDASMFNAKQAMDYLTKKGIKHIKFEAATKPAAKGSYGKYSSMKSLMALVD